MAHGFLTPQAVSGDRFWQNAKWLKDQLDKLLKEKKKEPQEKGGGLATTQKGGIVDENLKAVRVTDVTAPKAQRNTPPAARMLKQSAVAGALKPGVDSIVKKEQLALPPGGPRLPGSASPTKGGTFTNIPGVTAAPKKLDSEAFFKAAQTGVHPETGKYLSSEERKEYLKKSKSQMNASASVAAGGASGIDSSSTVTKGDEEIVGSIEKLTKVTTSLVDVVKKQTSTQKQTADKASAKAETIANRAKATEEEKLLEEGKDNSDFMTPVGGIGAPKSPSSASAGGSGGLGIGTAMGAAGKIIGKAAPGIGARGAARALPRAAAAVAGKGGAKALMKMGGKTAARMIPGAQTAIGLGLAGEALSRGDILGAALSAGSAIPGPLGWGFLAADVARDVIGGGGEGKGMAGGGLVTGGKKSVVDDVKINADEGEVVMSNAAGNTWGRSTLMAMNAMGGGTNKPTGGGKKYAEGGLVGGDAAKSKKMFAMFGEGMIDAQKENSKDFAKIQSQGLKQYYESEGGGKKLGENLAMTWKGLDWFKNLFGGGGGGGDPGGGPDGTGGMENPSISGSEKDYLMRLMIAEAGGQGDIGMAAVARSVLNRAGLIQSGTVGAGTFNSKSGSITDVINASGQFQPVAQGKLKRALSAEEQKRAMAALDIAMNQADMRGRLEAKGMKADQINKLMAATGFRAGSAFDDPSQNVNVTKLGDHYFNTAGNRGLRVAGQVAIQDGPAHSPGEPGTGRATFGETGNVSNAAGYVHGHFQTNTGSKADVVNDVLPIVRGLLNSGVSDVSITSGEKFNKNMKDTEIRSLIERGISKHTHSGDGRSVDIFVPKGTKVPFPLADVRNTGGRGGVTGVLPGSGKVWVGHLDPKSRSGGTGNRPRPQEPMVAARPRTKADTIGSSSPSTTPSARPARPVTGQDVADASAFYTSGFSNSGGGNTTYNIAASSNGGRSGGGSSNSAYPSSGSSGMGALSALRLRVQ